MAKKSLHKSIKVKMVNPFREDSRKNSCRGNVKIPLQEMSN